MIRKVNPLFIAVRSYDQPTRKPVGLVGDDPPPRPPLREKS
jgi:hypothetical protein